MLASSLRKIWTNKGSSRRPRRERPFAPRLEALDARIVLTTASYNAVSNTLTVTGTSAAESIVLRHHGNAEVKVEGGGINTTFSNVINLKVYMNGGDDVVRYMLDGDLSANMWMDVELGSGNNRFTGTLNQDLLYQYKTISTSSVILGTT